MSDGRSGPAGRILACTGAQGTYDNAKDLGWRQVSAMRCARRTPTPMSTDNDDEKHDVKEVAQPLEPVLFLLGRVVRTVRLGDGRDVALEGANERVDEEDELEKQVSGQAGKQRTAAKSTKHRHALRR